jgi:hypothetical protein
MSETGVPRDVDMPKLLIVVTVHISNLYAATIYPMHLLNAVQTQSYKGATFVQSYRASTFFLSVLTSSPPTVAAGPSNNRLALTSKASIINPATLGATALLNAAYTGFENWKSSVK